MTWVVTTLIGLIGLLGGALASILYSKGWIDRLNESWRGDLHKGFAEINAKVDHLRDRTDERIEGIHSRVTDLATDLATLKGERRAS